MVMLARRTAEGYLLERGRGALELQNWGPTLFSGKPTGNQPFWGDYLRNTYFRLSDPLGFCSSTGPPLFHMAGILVACNKDATAYHSQKSQSQPSHLHICMLATGLLTALQPRESQLMPTAAGHQGTRLPGSERVYEGS